MANWSDLWLEDRPRWGTYSVKAHQKLDRLIPDLLMYDVLVFPGPDTDQEYARWKDVGWDPSLLAHRVTQLGDHAAVCPWDPTLRSGWESDWWRLPPEQRENPETAFALTAAMLAEQSFVTLMGEEDDRFDQAVLNRPRVHSAFEGAEAWTRMRKEKLELVAAFQTDDDAVALTGSGGLSGRGISAQSQGDGRQGIRLKLQLEHPVTADEETLHRTLDLIEDDDFQRARRRLWSWESTLPVEEALHTGELTAGLDALVEDYNRCVRQQKWEIARSLVFLIVPAVAGVGIDAATGGGWTGAMVGTGASFAFDAVRARFPSLTGKAGRASHHPGSAVEGMLSIAGVARPTGQ